MKYIDADRLKAEIERKIAQYSDWAEEEWEDDREYNHGAFGAFKTVMRIVDSLQQEQLPGIEEHGIPGKDFIPVEWVDACEKYGKWKIVQQEQPEVDLEEEIKNYLATECAEDDEPSVSEIARHFYELRNHALEEAARHVYESWMGGTMDDFLRDMVELGKVLNARKEEYYRIKNQDGNSVL